MTTFLETVIAHTQDELSRRRAAVPIDALRAQIEGPPPAPAAARHRSRAAAALTLKIDLELTRT